MLLVLETGATILTVLGLFFISRGSDTGFLISAFGCVFWAMWAAEKQALGLMVTNALILIINLNGLLHFIN